MVGGAWGPPRTELWYSLARGTCCGSHWTEDSTWHTHERGAISAEPGPSVYRAPPRCPVRSALGAAWTGRSCPRCYYLRITPYSTRRIQSRACMCQEIDSPLRTIVQRPLADSTNRGTYYVPTTYLGTTYGSVARLYAALKPKSAASGPQQVEMVSSSVAQTTSFGPSESWFSHDVLTLLPPSPDPTSIAHRLRRTAWLASGCQLLPAEAGRCLGSRGIPRGSPQTIWLLRQAQSHASPGIPSHRSTRSACVLAELGGYSSRGGQDRTGHLRRPPAVACL